MPPRGTGPRPPGGPRRPGAARGSRAVPPIAAGSAPRSPRSAATTGETARRAGTGRARDTPSRTRPGLPPPHRTRRPRSRTRCETRSPGALSRVPRMPWSPHAWLFRSGRIRPVAGPPPPLLHLAGPDVPDRSGPSLIDVWDVDQGNWLQLAQSTVWALHPLPGNLAVRQSPAGGRGGNQLRLHARRRLALGAAFAATVATALFLPGSVSGSTTSACNPTGRAICISVTDVDSVSHTTQSFNRHTTYTTSISNGGGSTLTNVRATLQLVDVVGGVDQASTGALVAATLPAQCTLVSQTRATCELPNMPAGSPATTLGPFACEDLDEHRRRSEARRHRDGEGEGERQRLGRTRTPTRSRSAS